MRKNRTGTALAQGRRDYGLSEGTLTERRLKYYVIKISPSGQSFSQSRPHANII